jgi:hypothetical protein
MKKLLMVSVLVITPVIAQAHTWYFLDFKNQVCGINPYFPTPDSYINALRDTGTVPKVTVKNSGNTTTAFVTFKLNDETVSNMYTRS